MLCCDNYFLGSCNDQHVRISATCLLCLYCNAVSLGRKQYTIALLCHCPVPSMVVLNPPVYYVSIMYGRDVSISLFLFVLEIELN